MHFHKQFKGNLSRYQSYRQIKAYQFEQRNSLANIKQKHQKIQNK